MNAAAKGINYSKYFEFNPYLLRSEYLCLIDILRQDLQPQQHKS